MERGGPRDRGSGRRRGNEIQLFKIDSELRFTRRKRFGYDEISIEVSVRRDELLDRLKKNREKHDVEYHAAMKLWQQCLSETLQSIDSSSCFQFPSALSRLSSECPVSHIEEYDRAIDIFSMGINDEIKLDSSAFNQFCRDEWDWKQSTATNRFYRLAIQAQS